MITEAGIRALLRGHEKRLDERLRGHEDRLVQRIEEAIRRVLREESSDDDERWINTLQMAARLGMTERGFVHWYQRHPDLYFLHQRQGRHLRWPVAAVLAWFRRHRP